MNRFITFLVFILLFSHIGSGYSQSTQKNSLGWENINSTQITSYVDSLKITMLNDTSKFSMSDLVYSTLGYRNKNGYSPLFIIDERYFYKLDVISPDQVSEFIYQCLDSSKIGKIVVLNNAFGSAIYGTLGSNGVIMITMKINADFNPEIAGLKIKGNKITYNFSERRNEDLLIKN